MSPSVSSRPVRGRWWAAVASALLMVSMLPAGVGAAEPSPWADDRAAIERVQDRLRASIHVHDDGSTHRHADDLTDRELASIGLRRGTGACAGLFEWARAGAGERCTHGIDLAAAEMTAGSITTYPAPTGWTTPNRIPCYSTGPFVEVLFVYPTGGTNRYTQMRERVRRAIAAMDQLFAVSATAVKGTDGKPSVRHVRWAMDSGCKVRITVASTSAPLDLFAIKDNLVYKGVIKPDRKYLAFLDDGSSSCSGGVAEIAVDQRASATLNLNNRGGSFGMVMPGCLDSFNPYAGFGATIGAHELMHTLGGVQGGAPHVTDIAREAGHCWDDGADPHDGADVMCYQDGLGTATSKFFQRCKVTYPETFDCGKDDYFNPNAPSGTYLRNYWNPANNQFLARSAPPAWETIPLVTTSLSPSTGPIGGSEVVFSAAVTVPTGRTVTRVEFRVNGALVDTDFDAPWGTTVDTTAFTNLSNIKVSGQAFDDLDYPGPASARTLTVANPQVHLDTPVGSANVGRSMAWSVTAGAYGGRTINRVELLANGMEIAQDTGAPFGGTVDLGATAAGSAFDLSARVVDSAGVTRTTPVRTVWAVAPSIAVVPAGDSFDPWPLRAAQATTLHAAVTTPSGASVARVDFHVNNTLVGTDASGPYSVSWNPGTASSTKTMVARAYDASGALVATSATSHLAVAPAESTVSIVAPSAGTPVSGTSVPVSVEFSSTSQTPSSADLHVDGQYAGWIDVTTGEGAWDSTSWTPGTHVLQIRAQLHDEGTGQTSQVSSLPVVVSVNNPVVGISVAAPANAARVKDVVSVSAGVTNPAGRQVYGVTFYNGGTVIDWDETAPYSVQWDTRTTGDGIVRLRAVVDSDDPAAYQVESAPRFVIIKNLYAWFSGISSGTTVAGTVTLRAGGRCDLDCSLETATFRIDGVPVNYDRVAPYQFAWDSRKVADGAHTVSVVITTNDNRAVGSATFPFFVNNP